MVEYKLELEKVTNELKKTKAILKNTEEHLESVSELFEITKNDLQQIQTKENLTEREINIIKTLNTKLEKSLQKTVTNNYDLEVKLEKINEKKDEEIENSLYDMVRTIAEKNKAIETSKVKIAQSEKILRRVKDGLEITIEDQIKKLHKQGVEIEIKTKNITDLTKKSTLLEKQVIQAQSSMRMIEKISSILQQKGFITDKEFEGEYLDIKREQFISNL